MLWKHQKWLAVLPLISPIMYILVFSIAMSSFVGEVEIAGLGTIAYKDFVIPGLIILGAYTSSMLSAISLYLDAETKMLKEVLTLPLSIYSYILGKLLACCMKTAVSMLITMLLALMLGVPFRSPSETLAVALATALAFSSFSLFIVSFIRAQSTYNMVVNIVTIPLAVFSNIYYPLEKLPTQIELIARCNPISAIITLLRSYMFSPHVDYIAIAVYGALSISLCVLSAVTLKRNIYRHGVM